MKITQLQFEQAAFYLTCGSVAAILCSIAVSNILLALAFAALLLSNQKMRFPPFWLPLVLFFAGTVVSVLLSADPQSGRPAIRKFFVFLTVLVVYSTVRSVDRVRGLLMVCAGIAALSALWSLIQFAQKVSRAQAAGQPFYEYYMHERIGGFMSHWMTLGGQEMIILLMICALIFFSSAKRWNILLMAAAAMIGVSIAAGWTRIIWLATFCGIVYLTWFWKRWVLALLPVPVLLLLLVNPFDLRERMISAFRPHGDTDSNEFRVVVRRAGIRMVAAHPWFGLGPERVKAELKDWIPADVPRPLPMGWYGHVHNLYVQYAAERGIPTLLAFLCMLGKILYDFVRALRRPGAVNRDARAILHGAIAMMIGILISGYYEVNLGDSEVLILFLGVVSCAYVAADCLTEADGALAG
jgi:putative inorganic carbon (hco3(-)) transporter